jgi:4-hydroxythreonine-4-phosphate dehydrogenase
VGLTIGDPAGIGPAITLKAFNALKDKVNFVIIGDSFVLDRQASLLGIKSITRELVDLNNVEKKGFSFGEINAQNGKASLEYLDEALDLIKKNKIDCLVTSPISKEAVSLRGVKFLGHTEYLADKTGFKDLLMILVNKKLRFSLLTRHIALKKVPAAITKSNLKNNILKTIKCLNSLFLIKSPKIAVCGINPHASDNGVIGKEEKRLIVPAVRNLSKRYKGAVIVGPLSADVAISEAAQRKFDCVIAAYHDQALIPLKLSDPDSGVNLTFGLPFVRTSPLHGTAFDIANKAALANPSSLICAIKLAVGCTLNLRKV